MRREQWIVAIVGLGVAAALHLGRHSRGDPLAIYATPSPSPERTPGSCGNNPNGLCISFVGNLDRRTSADLKTAWGSSAGRPQAPQNAIELLARSDAIIGNLGQAWAPARHAAPNANGTPEARSCSGVTGMLDKMGFRPLGVGPDRVRARRPHQYEHPLGSRIFRLAILAVVDPEAMPKGGDAEGSCVLARLEVNRVAREIRALKAEDPTPYVVVIAAWKDTSAGEADARRRKARTLAQAGADLVIGRGGDGLDSLEWRRPGWIVSGLGTLGQASEAPPTERNRARPVAGILQLLVATEGDTRRLRLYPTLSSRGDSSSRVRLASIEELAETYWHLLVRAYGFDKRLKRRLRPARDSAGRHLELRSSG